jgi:hypothetical protein
LEDFPFIEASIWDNSFAEFDQTYSKCPNVSPSVVTCPICKLWKSSEEVVRMRGRGGEEVGEVTWRHVVGSASHVALFFSLRGLDRGDETKITQFDNSRRGQQHILSFDVLSKI